jgi:hypothetical protein
MQNRKITWRAAPLSCVSKVKTEGKIWLEGRAASPFAERGRHFKNVDGEVFVSRHYALEERAFDRAKLRKFCRKLNSGDDFGEINIRQKQSQFRRKAPFRKT